MSLLEKMEKQLIPVVVLERTEDAVPLAKAMYAGGLSFMEVTLRTENAVKCIRILHEQCPEMHVGAGTVLNRKQLNMALEAGASFIVTPGYEKELVDICREKDVPIVPGGVTPTEIMRALEDEVKIVKYFPASLYGGLQGMKALAAPFRQVRFIPTGGVNQENLEDYIKQPFVYAVGGSFVCKEKDILDGNFEKITKLCKEATKITGGYES